MFSSSFLLDAFLLSSFSSSAPPPHLHSFPTRRSSDLPTRGGPGLPERGGVPAGAGHTADDQPGAPSGSPLRPRGRPRRSEEHTSELQSRGHLVCRLLLEKKKKTNHVRVMTTFHDRIKQ